MYVHVHELWLEGTMKMAMHYLHVALLLDCCILYLCTICNVQLGIIKLVLYYLHVALLLE